MLFLSPIFFTDFAGIGLSTGDPVVDNVDNPSSMQLAGTSTTWHDDCSSTVGWISQSTSSGFDPKHTILESGSLSSSGGYFSVTGIADPVTERKGPLYIKELSEGVSISSIELFQAEVEFTYYSNTYGFLSVYLFDESKQKAVMLRLHDAWAASESHPESAYFDPGEAGDGTLHYEILFGSWTGFLRFWYDESTGAIVGELDDGTPNQAILKTSGTFDTGRSIKYIGIQWSRHPGLPYNSDAYRLLDVQLTYEKTHPASDWLTGWMNRKSHEILGTPGTGVNYQVPIIVNFGSGTDSNNSVYCDFNCQPDFDDIRFTRSDGSTLLDYWRESYFDSDNGTFWVEIKDNLDSNVSIYIYYGNTDSTTTSNGDATFVFFDDFDDGSIDANKWETYGPWTESGGVASFSIAGTGGTSVLPDLMSDDAWDMRNKSIVSRWRVNALTVNREWGVSCADTVGDDHTRLAYFLALNTSGNDNVRSYYDTNAASGYDYYNLIIGQYPPSVFMKTEFVSTPNNVTKNSWVLDGNVLDTYSGTSFDSTPQRIFLGFYVHGYTNTLDSGNLEMEFDWVYLRNQVGLELAHGAWGELESEPSDGLGWLSGWEFRKEHQIEGSAGAGTNYQIRIAVHFGSGIDNGEDVYCNGYCRPDFADIRFTDNDGSTILDHWQVPSVSSTEASFWVEIRDTLDHNQSIYIYYGNPGAPDTSNGDETFTFFDDFEDSLDVQKWETLNGSISTSNGNLVLEGNSTTRGFIEGNVAFGPGHALHSRALGSDTMLDNMHWCSARESGNWDNRVDLYGRVALNEIYLETWNDGALERTQVDVSSLNSWHEYFWTWEVGVARAYQDSTLYVTHNTEIPTMDLEVIFLEGNIESDAVYVDWVFVRRFASVEPTHDVWSALETAFSLNSPPDVTYEAGTTSNSVVWTASSEQPHSYVTLLDGVQQQNNTWDGSNIILSVDGLDPGLYNYTLIVSNLFGFTRNDSVFVVVEDTTEPVLTHPDDVEYTEGDQGNEITWTLNDLYPDRYQIHLDGELLQAGAWNSTGESLILSVDGFLVGIYNVSISAIDGSGNSAVDYVTVTVQPIFPIMIIIMAGGVVAVVIIGAVVCRMKKS
jgi:hypothetical protein